MEVCPPRMGASAATVVELFERVTQEAFSDTPGALLTSRIRGMAKVMGNVSREEEWTPALESLSVRGTLMWNRRPKAPRDVEAWRRAIEQAEAHAAPVRRLRDQMAEADAGLAPWLKGHRYLLPADVEVGESGMALLLLWEVDHQQPYPNQGGDGLSGALVGFTRRLQDRVSKDPELSWLQWKDMSAPLSAGLAPSYHRRWSVKVMAPGPGEPHGWYEDFVGRWRAYLEALARPRGSRPLADVSEEVTSRIRPRSVQAERQMANSSLVPGGGREGRHVERTSPPRKRRVVADDRPLGQRKRPAGATSTAPVQEGIAKRQKGQSTLLGRVRPMGEEEVTCEERKKKVSDKTWTCC